MTRPSLARVLDAVVSGDVAAWRAATPSITAERAAVERLLQSDPAPVVYGFTTLFGQLDAVAQGPEAADGLFAAHLIGPTYPLDGASLRLVAACKAEQLHHGGSGLHPLAYDAVIAAAATTGADAVGAWDASYGSGDVVPAAWWLAGLRNRGEVDLTRRGELIALINGNFFSTAAAIAAGAALVSSGARALANLSRVAARGAAAGSARQLPISSRDVAPISDALVGALTSLGEALERRLGAPSANPLFVATGVADDVTARSQSSFLDYTATFALTGLTQATLLVASVSQRLIATTTAERLADGIPDPGLVQRPKVAQAILEAAQLEAGTLPSRFSSAESDGIEDLRDLSLVTALRARRLIDYLDQVTELLDELEPADADTDREALEFEGVLAAALFGESVADERVDELARLRFDRRA